MSLQIKGLDELKKKLSEMEKDIQNEVFIKALEEGATLIEEKQKELAPYKEGTLKDSLKKHKVSKKKGQSVIKIGVDKSASKHIKDVAYYQNYGFKGVSGKFFMEESFEQSQKEALEKIKKVLADSLK